jgi:hypothetical protein
MKSFLSGRPSSQMGALKPVVKDGHPKANMPGKTPARATPVGGAAGASAAEPHQHLPSVECIKQGDKVSMLVVTCSCGEKIEIDCLYAGPA